MARKTKRERELEHAIIFVAVFLFVGGIGGLKKALAPNETKKPEGA